MVIGTTMSSSSSSSSSHHSDAPPSTAHADVLCMGHFCEKHGPSVVFVTESVSERVAQHVAAYGAAATAAHTNTTTTSTTPCAMCRSFADGKSKTLSLSHRLNAI